MTQTDLVTLAQWLAGDFSNREQAFREPAFFSQIRVCHRPLPYAVFEGIGFYIEQAYDVFLDDPYRMRVYHLVLSEEGIVIKNFNLKDPTQWRGACREPDRLNRMTQEDLELLCGCNLILNREGAAFKGKVEPGKQCKVFRKGQDSYLVSEVEIRQGQFFSLDRGYSPETDEQLWGSYGGSFEFAQWTDFSHEVPTL
jgi:hypothetical protein